MTDDLKIVGTITDIVYRNPENSYTVCEVNTMSDGDVTAVGCIPCLSEGETVALYGEWVLHPDYGEQFSVKYYESVLPDSEEAILRYLGSGAVSGIREATAKKIVDKFGSDALNIMLTAPDRLAEIKGITAQKAKKIGAAFLEVQSMQGIVVFLQRYNISAAFAVKIHKVLGSNSVELIKKNPFILSECIEGISFKTSDSIAFSMGCPKNDPERITSGIKYILTNAAYTSGHTYLPKIVLCEYCEELLQVTQEEIQNGINNLLMNKQLYTEKENDDELIYLSGYYNAEKYVARRLISMSLTKSMNMPGTSELEKLLESVEQEESIELAAEQKEAVITAINSSVMVITGGPGTGKTTIINAIIKALTDMKYKIALTAPTGRAAKRMSELCGREAQTIHRLLGVQASDHRTFTHNENNRLTADVIIVDELSMVELMLMYSLLKAIKPGAKLIMCGDSDQLPSVGAGNLLCDIINSGTVPTVRLNHIFRQASKSLIVVNAHRINNGEMPDLLTKNSDFFYIKRNDADTIAQTIVDLYKNRLPASYEINPISAIQVLSPAKKGTAGIISLNKELQYAINPPDMLRQEYTYGKVTFRVGDKVMQSKNNYDIPWSRENGEVGMGIFNGDMGLIESISVKDRVMTIIFDDDKEVEYSFAWLENLELAYAITVHKSQGSEFPIVIIPVCSFPQLLMYRNLFYTAVTRARDMVILVGRESAVMQMVNSTGHRKRFSGLESKLRSAADFENNIPF